MVFAMALVRSASSRASKAARPFSVEPPVHARDGLIQRLPVLHHAVAQEAVDELQELRPFAEPRASAASAWLLRRRLILRQAPGQQRQRLVRRHGVHRLALGLQGQNVVAARGDEPRGVPPALQERPQILLAPGVVDDEQDAAVAQRLAELGGGGVEVFQAGPLAGHDLDEVRR